MKTFKNTSANFKKLADATQILFAQGNEKPEGKGWIEQKDEEFEIEMEFVFETTHLFTENGTRFFGWM